jgi:hypothetical protein
MKFIEELKMKIRTRLTIPAAAISIIITGALVTVVTLRARKMLTMGNPIPVSKGMKYDEQ